MPFPAKEEAISHERHTPRKSGTLKKQISRTRHIKRGKLTKNRIPRREITIPRRGMAVSRRGIAISRRGTDLYIS